MSKEYIEREVAIKDVRSVPISNDFSGLLIELGVEKAVDALNKVPAADVVEVVRCKDCKHWSYAVCLGRHECNIFNGAYEFIGYPTQATDFCSYGERKGNEDAAD